MSVGSWQPLSIITNKFTVLMYNFQRKQSAVNTALGAIFTFLHFLCYVEKGPIR
jgi:hypothetical protein